MMYKISLEPTMHVKDRGKLGEIAQNYLFSVYLVGNIYVLGLQMR